ncbi:MAG: ABC transporter ATP-binding protein [Kiloniellales bacterium]
MADVVLSRAVKRYGRTVAIRGVDIAMADRQLTVVVGPSGCGKSTLLKVIAGLDDLDEGAVLIGGALVNHLPPARRDVAMVFQSYALYPHMTVFDNMAFPLRMARLDRAAIAAKVREAAAMLRLHGLLERKPAELSGGQQQRVAMGRAMVRDPAVYLFDEPLSNLDAQLRVEMREEIVRLKRELDATMIFVTHDQVEAMTLADRIVVLNLGAVEQTGTPLELYHRPANRFVAGFIGAPRMNFLPARVTHADARQVRVALTGGATLSLPVERGEAGDEVTLGIRPEHLIIGGEQAAETARLAAEVLRVESLGAQTNLGLATAVGPLTAVTPGEISVAVGERLTIDLAPVHCHLFDRQGRALERLERLPDQALPQASQLNAEAAESAEARRGKKDKGD